MSTTLAHRVTQMKPSASIAAKKKVTELQAAGHQIIDFTVGEPDLDTPAHIVDAAIQAMRHGETHYTATPGTPALRAAIVGKLRRENGLQYGSENIVVGSGAKQIILSAFEATLNEGDEVIVPAPFWVSYPDMVKLYDGKPVIVVCPEKDGFKLTAEALEAAITPKTRWLVLNSPNNPTGSVYNRHEINALADVLARHPQVMVLTDDIYEHIMFDNAEFVNVVQCAPNLFDRTLVVNGLSKSFAMTGWRVGYGAGPVDLVSAIVKLLGQSTTCASSISQAAAVAALDGKQTFVTNSCAEYLKRRDRMLELIGEIPGISVTKPQGAFYLYPSVAGLIGRTTPDGKTLQTDLDVSIYLLEEAKVAVLDGAAYGLSPYLRLSFATSLSAIEAGCAQIAEAVSKLR
ncbi:aminotransferase class I/II-fold pyridoxal phosphate-dependent enzyme [Allorhizobium sp. BGMRC 0089]|nr:aminotransferase class I/II-fold pyridoxal phosphate-dependent enzyme [Allorhizobium sonneratiae]